MEHFKVILNLGGATKSKAFGTFKAGIIAFKVIWLFSILFCLFALTQVTIFAYDSIDFQNKLESRQNLQKHLTFINKRLDSLNTEIEKSFKDESLIYEKYGMTAPDKDERKLGVGGKQIIDSLLYYKTNPIENLRNEVELKSKHLNRQLNRNEKSYGILKSFLEQKFTNWRHIPSISPTAGRFSSPFGTRIHPITGRKQMHAGIDISNNRWTPIYATADGIVITDKYSDSFGNYVAIDHGNGFITKYGHMHQDRVKLGQFVRRGDHIGYQGSTGHSTGNHLHYEVHFNNKPQNPMNYILPEAYSVD